MFPYLACTASAQPPGAQRDLIYCVTLARAVINTFPLRYLIFYMVKRKVMGDLWSHGIGRHSEQDLYGIAEKDMQAVSAILGQKKFLFGEKPCLADAAVFAFIAASTWDCPQSPSAALTKSKAKNLEEHARRMKEIYYPDWDDIISRKKHKSD